MLLKNFKLVLTLILSGWCLVVLGLSIWWLINRTTTNSTEKNSSIKQTICWNRVIAMDNQYYWPDGCKGDPKRGSTLCTTLLVELTVAEKEAYLKWLQNPYPLDPKCNYKLYKLDAAD
jgi:hypothetical protein